MAKDRRTRDQKRKAQLAKRKQRSRQLMSLAYMGRKFQTEELSPIWLQTELGIYEVFVITERNLLDKTVAAALEKLIIRMRAGTLPLFENDAEINYEVGREEDLVIDMIRRRWQTYFEDNWQPPQDKLIGVVRTILGSIKLMRSPSLRSQSYLHHISKFLTNKLGVDVRQFSADGRPLSESAEEDGGLVFGRR